MKPCLRSIAVVAGALAALAAIGSLEVPVVSATTSYFPGSSYWGKTYRNNYVGSGCYDQYGSYSACYQGTWAETYWPNATVSVVERPQKWIPTIPGNYGGPFYWYQHSDISNIGTTDTVVSSDYDAYFDHRSDSATYTTHGNLDTLSYVTTYDE